MCLDHDLQVLLRSGHWSGGGLAWLWKYNSCIMPLCCRLIMTSAMEVVAGQHGDAVTSYLCILGKVTIVSVSCFLQRLPVATYFALDNRDSINFDGGLLAIKWGSFNPLRYDFILGGSRLAEY